MLCLDGNSTSKQYRTQVARSPATSFLWRAPFLYLYAHRRGKSLAALAGLSAEFGSIGSQLFNDIKHLPFGGTTNLALGVDKSQMRIIYRESECSEVSAQPLIVVELRKGSATSSGSFGNYTLTVLMNYFETACSGEQRKFVFKLSGSDA